jgi:hypothetical protein
MPETLAETLAETLLDALKQISTGSSSGIPEER